MLMMKFCTVTVKPVFALGEYDDDDDDGYDGDDESSHGQSESSVFAPRDLCKGRDRTGGQPPVEFIKRGGKGEWTRSAITRSVLIAFRCLISWSECVRKAIQSGFGFIATASCAIPPSRTLPNGPQPGSVPAHSHLYLINVIRSSDQNKKGFVTLCE